MKTLLLFILLIALAFSSFSQSESINIKTKDYYLTKSKHQKTLAWVMLGGGAALTGVGIAVAGAETDAYALGTDNHTTAGVVLATVGIASTLGSIPFFISASHNKRRAAEVAFNVQKIPTLPAGFSYTVFQPTLMLKIKL